MDITITSREGGAVVAPAGRFDAHECTQFRDTVTPLITGGGDTELDLSAVTFLDSSALAELVRARKRARASGGDAVVTTVSDPVRIILELTGLAAALSTRRVTAGAA